MHHPSLTGQRFVELYRSVCPSMVRVGQDKLATMVDRAVVRNNNQRLRSHRMSLKSDMSVTNLTSNLSTRVSFFLGRTTTRVRLRRGNTVSTKESAGTRNRHQS